jgi:hypothetical protein
MKRCQDADALQVLDSRTNAHRDIQTAAHTAVSSTVLLFKFYFAQYQLSEKKTGCGTFFKLIARGTLTTLYSFCSQANCTDGVAPSGLVQAADGNFYGTTNYAQPDELVGIEAIGELKTSIASSIATNISPTPSYEIAECSLPTTPARKLAVIRVRQGNQIYYLTKKGEKPIYVRNEDESIPADAARLRALREGRPVQNRKPRYLIASTQFVQPYGYLRTHDQAVLRRKSRLSLYPLGIPA